MITTPSVPLTATLRFTVTDDDTASTLGSGSLPVLATPRLLAWFEAATCAALEPTLEEGTTSVGTRARLEHVAPSAIGRELEVTATAVTVDGRYHRFTVTATHVADGAPAGDPVGSAEVTRVVVDVDRFLARLTP